MGIFDSLFGTTENKAQEEQNKKSSEYTQQQAALAQAAAQALYGDSRYPLQMGYQGAADATSAALKSAIDVSGKGNLEAQKLLLAGMPQFQNAIMGLPVDYSALQPVSITPDDGSLAWLDNVEIGKRTGDHAGEGLPDITDPNKEQTTGEISGVTPGMSNRATVDQLFRNGLLTQQEYDIMQKTFRDDPEVANASTWSSAGSADQLINRDWSGVSPEYSATLQKVFSSIYS